MQSWFLIALIAPVLWSIVNHLDKYILKKYENGNGVGKVLIFSLLFSIVVPIGILIFGDVPIAQFALTGREQAILVVMAIVSALAFWLYLEGLEQEEASVVTPMMQMMPMFGYILSYIILGEILSIPQLFSSILIILGVLLLSIEINGEHGALHLKQVVLAYVGLSAFFYALHDVLFKYIAQTHSFLVVSFWLYLFIALIGIFVLVCVPEYRRQFFFFFKQHERGILYTNTIAESLYTLGNLASNFAMLLAPVTLVLVVSSYQPLFVFIIGVTLAKFMPHLVYEKITRTHLIQKVIAISIIVAGSYFLHSAI